MANPVDGQNVNRLAASDACAARLGPDGTRMADAYAAKYSKMAVDGAANAGQQYGGAIGRIAARGAAGQVLNEGRVNWYSRQLATKLQSAVYGNDPQKLGEFVARRFDELFDLMMNAVQDLSEDDFDSRGEYTEALKGNLQKAYLKRQVSSMMAVEAKLHQKDGEALTPEMLRTKLEEKLALSYTPEEYGPLVDYFMSAREGFSELSRSDLVASLEEAMYGRFEHLALPASWGDELQLWTEGSFDHLNEFLKQKLHQIREVLPQDAKILHLLMGLVHSASDVAMVQSFVKGQAANQLFEGDKEQTSNHLMKFLDRIKSAELAVSPLERTIKDVEKSSGMHILGLSDETRVQSNEIVWKINELGERTEVLKVGRKAAKWKIEAGQNPAEVRVRLRIEGKEDKVKQRDERIVLGPHDILYDHSYGLPVVRATGEAAHAAGVKRGMTQEDANAKDPDAVEIFLPKPKQVILNEEGMVVLVGRGAASLGIEEGMTLVQAQAKWAETHLDTELSTKTATYAEEKKMKDNPPAEVLLEKLLYAFTQMPENNEKRALHALKKKMNFEVRGVTIPTGSALAFCIRMGITAPVRHGAKFTWRHLFSGPKSKKFARETAQRAITMLHSPATEFCALRLISETLELLKTNTMAAEADGATRDYEAVKANPARQFPDRPGVQDDPYFIGNIALHAVNKVVNVADPAIKKTNSSIGKRLGKWALKRSGDVANVTLQVANTRAVRAVNRVGIGAVLGVARFFTPQDGDVNRPRTRMERFVEVTEHTCDFTSRFLDVYGGSTNHGLICRGAPALAVASLDVLKKMEQQDTGLISSVSKKKPVFKYLELRPEELQGGGDSKKALVHKSAIVAARLGMQMARAKKVHDKPEFAYEGDVAWLESIVSEDINLADAGADREELTERLTRLRNQVTAFVDENRNPAASIGRFEGLATAIREEVPFINHMITPGEGAQGLPAILHGERIETVTSMITYLEGIRDASEELMGGMMGVDNTCSEADADVRQALLSSNGAREINALIEELSGEKVLSAVGLSTRASVSMEKLPAYQKAQRILQFGAQCLEAFEAKNPAPEAENLEQYDALTGPLNLAIESLKNEADAAEVLGNLKPQIGPHRLLFRGAMQDSVKKKVVQGEYKLGSRHKHQGSVTEAKAAMDRARTTATSAIRARNKLVRDITAEAGVQEALRRDSQARLVEPGMVANVVGGAQSAAVNLGAWALSFVYNPVQEPEVVAPPVVEPEAGPVAAPTTQLDALSLIGREHYDRLGPEDTKVADALMALHEAQKKYEAECRRLRVLERQDIGYILNEANAGERWDMVQAKLAEVIAT